MDKPEIVREMRVAARKRVVEKYEWDRVISDFLKYYEQAVHS